MNKGGDEWWDWTWNPVTGCNKGCDYCYARQWWRRFHEARYGAFEPRLWRGRLDEPCGKKTAGVIFTVSMGDLFDPHLCNADRDAVMCMFDECARHEYVILTKNESGLGRYAQYLDVHGKSWPENLWVGVSVTREQDLDRVNVLQATVPTGQRVVCFEPLLEPVLTSFMHIDWVIIGGMTAQLGCLKFVPPVDWIMRIVRQARRDKVPVWIKRNACLTKLNLTQLPEAMRERLAINKVERR